MLVSSHDSRAPSSGKRDSQLKVGSMTAKNRVSSAVAPMSTSTPGAAVSQACSMAGSFWWQGVRSALRPKRHLALQSDQRAALVTARVLASTSPIGAVGWSRPTALFMARVIAWRWRVRPRGALCRMTRRNKPVESRRQSFESLRVANKLPNT